MSGAYLSSSLSLSFFQSSFTGNKAVGYAVSSWLIAAATATRHMSLCLMLVLVMGLRFPLCPHALVLI